ncbi:membrane-spanning 4-domains subfamily A member 7 isoform X1 [Cebus imitator]|uniref:membrane-spanning 4-domains subfamily A member 7 isoform X1 n=1 Tax=Cebus imitator TaxID=2715852 RepID=UPI00080A218F|nr:membrane-spanning 4-domains subfamily A member 7 isoform X1 [Cebus imitator]XP_017354350.1 membrane-spanning 4-domains subfamily A member 7 isoform X1 [Cebus imitator]XP_037583915.1 membrane-spanning 4-domains subfamily A member 7 isoform X1 [Cebus imitator]
MLLQSQTMRAFDIFTPKGITIPERQKPGHTYQKEDYQQSGLPKEATVLGIVQIPCCLMISSLGVILVFAPYPSHFNSEISTTLMSGYPFLGALCFGVTGSLSIISGKQSTKPFDLSSLTSNAVSSVTAGAGLLLLADSVVALRTASQHCGSEKEYLSSLPYSEYYYPIYEIRDCVLTSVSLTVSSFRLNILSCEISVSSLCITSVFLAVSGPVGPNAWRQTEINKHLWLEEACLQTAWCGGCTRQSQKRKSRTTGRLSLFWFFLLQTFQPR